MKIELTSKQKMMRILTLIVGAYAAFFTGYPHIWAVYQPVMIKEFGWSADASSMCFYIAISCFVFGNIIGGKLQDRLSVSTISIIGGIIYVFAIFGAYFVVSSNPIPTYITFGVMQGIGQGMTYITAIVAAQKWFPGRTGFSSGIIVTATGISGLLLIPLNRGLIAKGGVRHAFLIMGILILISLILCILFFRMPSKEFLQKAEEMGLDKPAKADHKDYTTGEMLKTKSFYFLIATMIFGLIPYFMLSPVAQTHQIKIGISENVAVFAVMLGAILNASFRIAIPTIGDRGGRIPFLQAILAALTVVMIVLGFSNSFLATISTVVVYGAYGGIMGSFPSLTSSIFGLKHNGANYGLVLLGMAIATIGTPFIVRPILASGNTMHTVFFVGAISGAISFISLFILKKEVAKK